MDLTKLARHLRKNMTHEEVKLWVQLQYLNKQGYHFRRQVPLDGYVLDFAEFNQRLIIEVDGSQHGEPDGEMRDRLRDAHFVSARFRVLRFWNVEINREMDGVVTKIQSMLKDPPPSAARPPPP
jgi:very-short-patch-repair endonuclease